MNTGERHDEGYLCRCGHWHQFPAWFGDRRHVLYTLICDCGLVYTVSLGVVSLQTKLRGWRG
jgi:hypothetical protein